MHAHTRAHTHTHTHTHMHMIYLSISKTVFFNVDRLFCTQSPQAVPLAWSIIFSKNRKKMRGGKNFICYTHTHTHTQSHAYDL